MFTVRTYVFGLITYLYQAKTEPIWDHGPKKFVMIASHIHNPSATFSMNKNTANHVSMALFPPPLVLLDSPGIDNISYKV
jgi:hypothetical protein